MCQNFIGIDTGKSLFFVATADDKTMTVSDNSTQGFALFKKQYQNVNVLVVLET